MTRVTLRCNVFLTFSYPSHLKHLLLRAFLESCFPEMLSKVGVLDRRGMKKSKKHHAIAPARVHGPWSMDHGPWTMVHGPWSMDHGLRTMVHGWKSRHNSPARSNQCENSESTCNSHSTWPWCLVFCEGAFLVRLGLGQKNCLFLLFRFLITTMI